MGGVMHYCVGALGWEYWCVGWGIGVGYDMWPIIGLDKFWRGGMMRINPAIDFLGRGGRA